MYSDGTVSLAPFEREDLPKVLGWVNDPELCRAVDRVLPVTRVEHERWYESLVNRADAVTFAIQYKGETIGLCGLKDLHPRCHRGELWIYIGDGSRRKRGMGRRAVRLLARFGFDQLNLHRIYLYVIGDNETARRAFRACGFSEEGWARDHVYLNGTHHDALCMGILRGELIDQEESLYAGVAQAETCP